MMKKQQLQESTKTNAVDDVTRIQQRFASTCAALWQLSQLSPADRSALVVRDQAGGNLPLPPLLRFKRQFPSFSVHRKPHEEMGKEVQPDNNDHRSVASTSDQAAANDPAAGPSSELRRFNAGQEEGDDHVDGPPPSSSVSVSVPECDLPPPRHLYRHNRRLQEATHVPHDEVIDSGPDHWTRRQAALREFAASDRLALAARAATLIATYGCLPEADRTTSPSVSEDGEGSSVTGEAESSFVKLCHLLAALNSLGFAVARAGHDCQCPVLPTARSEVGDVDHLLGLFTACSHCRRVFAPQPSNESPRDFVLHEMRDRFRTLVHPEEGIAVHLWGTSKAAQCHRDASQRISQYVFEHGLSPLATPASVLFTVHGMAVTMTALVPLPSLIPEESGPVAIRASAITRAMDSSEREGSSFPREAPTAEGAAPATNGSVSCSMALNLAVLCRSVCVASSTLAVSGAVGVRDCSNSVAVVAAPDGYCYVLDVLALSPPQHLAGVGNGDLPLVLRDAAATILNGAVHAETTGKPRRRKSRVVPGIEEFSVSKALQRASTTPACDTLRNNDEPYHHQRGEETSNNTDSGSVVLECLLQMCLPSAVDSLLQDTRKALFTPETQPLFATAATAVVDALSRAPAMVHSSVDDAESSGLDPFVTAVNDAVFNSVNVADGDRSFFTGASSSDAALATPLAKAMSTVVAAMAKQGVVGDVMHRHGLNMRFIAAVRQGCVHAVDPFPHAPPESSLSCTQTDTPASSAKSSATQRSRSSSPATSRSSSRPISSRSTPRSSSRSSSSSTTHDGDGSSVHESTTMTSGAAKRSEDAFVAAAIATLPQILPPASVTSNLIDLRGSHGPSDLIIQDGSSASQGSEDDSRRKQRREEAVKATMRYLTALCSGIAAAALCDVAVLSRVIKHQVRAEAVAALRRTGDDIVQSRRDSAMEVLRTSATNDEGNTNESNDVTGAVLSTLDGDSLMSIRHQRDSVVAAANTVTAAVLAVDAADDATVTAVRDALHHSASRTFGSGILDFGRICVPSAAAPGNSSTFRDSAPTDGFVAVLDLPALVNAAVDEHGSGILFDSKARRFVQSNPSAPSSVLYKVPAVIQRFVAANRDAAAGDLLMQAELDAVEGHVAAVCIVRNGPPSLDDQTTSSMVPSPRLTHDVLMGLTALRRAFLWRLLGNVEAALASMVDTVERLQIIAPTFLVGAAEVLLAEADARINGASELVDSARGGLHNRAVAAGQERKAAQSKQELFRAFEETVLQNAAATNPSSTDKDVAHDSHAETEATNEEGHGDEPTTHVTKLCELFSTPAHRMMTAVRTLVDSPLMFWGAFVAAVSIARHLPAIRAAQHSEKKPTGEEQQASSRRSSASSSSGIAATRKKLTPRRRPSRPPPLAPIVPSAATLLTAQVHAFLEAVVALCSVNPACPRVESRGPTDRMSPALGSLSEPLTKTGFLFWAVNRLVQPLLHELPAVMKSTLTFREQLLEGLASVSASASPAPSPAPTPTSGPEAPPAGVPVPPFSTTQSRRGSITVAPGDMLTSSDSAAALGPPQGQLLRRRRSSSVTLVLGPKDARVEGRRDAARVAKGDRERHAPPSLPHHHHHTMTPRRSGDFTNAPIRATSTIDDQITAFLHDHDMEEDRRTYIADVVSALLGGHGNEHRHRVEGRSPSSSPSMSPAPASGSTHVPRYDEDFPLTLSAATAVSEATAFMRHYGWLCLTPSVGPYGGLIKHVSALVSGNATPSGGLPPPVVPSPLVAAAHNAWPPGNHDADDDDSTPVADHAQATHGGSTALPFDTFKDSALPKRRALHHMQQQLRLAQTLQCVLLGMCEDVSAATRRGGNPFHSIHHANEGSRNVLDPRVCFWASAFLSSVLTEVCTQKQLTLATHASSDGAETHDRNVHAAASVELLFAFPCDEHDGGSTAQVPWTSQPCHGIHAMSAVAQRCARMGGPGLQLHEASATLHRMMAHRALAALFTLYQHSKRDAKQACAFVHEQASSRIENIVRIQRGFFRWSLATFGPEEGAPSYGSPEESKALASASHCASSRSNGTGSAAHPVVVQAVLALACASAIATDLKLRVNGAVTNTEPAEPTPPSPAPESVTLPASVIKFVRSRRSGDPQRSTTSAGFAAAMKQHQELITAARTSVAQAPGVPARVTLGAPVDQHQELSSGAFSPCDTTLLAAASTNVVGSDTLAREASSSSVAGAVSPLSQESAYRRGSVGAAGKLAGALGASVSPPSPQSMASTQCGTNPTPLTALSSRVLLQEGATAVVRGRTSRGSSLSGASPRVPSVSPSPTSEGITAAALARLRRRSSIDVSLSPGSRRGSSDGGASLRTLDTHGAGGTTHRSRHSATDGGSTANRNRSPSPQAPDSLHHNVPPRAVAVSERSPSDRPPLGTAHTSSSPAPAAEITTLTSPPRELTAVHLFTAEGTAMTSLLRSLRRCTAITVRRMDPLQRFIVARWSRAMADQRAKLGLHPSFPATVGDLFAVDRTAVTQRDTTEPRAMRRAEVALNGTGLEGLSPICTQWASAKEPVLRGRLSRRTVAIEQRLHEVVFELLVVHVDNALSDSTQTHTNHVNVTLPTPQELSSSIAAKMGLPASVGQHDVEHTVSDLESVLALTAPFTEAEEETGSKPSEPNKRSASTSPTTMGQRRVSVASFPSERRGTFAADASIAGINGVRGRDGSLLFSFEEGDDLERTTAEEAALRWGATQLPSAEVKTLHSALREDSATKAAAALMVSLAMSQDYNTAATTAWLLRQKWFSASDDAAVEVTAAVRAFDALSAHVARAQIVLMYRVATRRATRLRSHDRPSAPAAELPSSRLARLTQRNYERVLATSLPSPRTLEQHRLGGTTNDTGSSTVLSRTALWAALWEASGFLARERRRLEDMEYYHRVALMIDELDVFLADLGITSMYKEERLLRDSIAGESLAAVGTMFAEFVSPMEESQRLDIELDHLQETEDMCRGIATIGEVMERDQMISRGVADLDRDCVRPEVTARCDIARSEIESAAELMMSEAETAEEVARHDLSATFAESTNRVSSIAELRHVVSIEEPTARFMLVLEEQETVMGEVKASLFATRTHEVAVGVLEHVQARDSRSLLMNEMEHFALDLMMAFNHGAAAIQHFLLGCEALEIVGLRSAGNVADRQSAREEAWRDIISLEEDHERSALAKAMVLGECEAHMEELCRLPKMMDAELSVRYELHRREFYERAKLEKWLAAHRHAAEVALCRSFVKEYMEAAVLPGSHGHLAHSVLVPTATFNARVLQLQAAEQSAAKAHTTTPHASTPRAQSHSSSSKSNSSYGDDFDDASTASCTDQSGDLRNQRASGRGPERMAVEVVTSAQVAGFARAEEAAAVYTALHPETPSSDVTALGGTNGGGARNDGLNANLERPPSSPTLEDLGWSGGFGRTPEQVPITTGQDRLRGFGGGSLSASAGSGQLQCFAGSPLGLLRRGSTATPLSPDGADAAVGLPLPIPDAGQSTSTRRYSVNAPSQYQYQRGPRGSIGRRQSSSVRLIDTLEQHSGGLVPQPSAALQSADGVQPAGAASSLIAQRPGVGVEPLAAIAQDLSSGLASVASFVSSGSATPIRSPLNITSSTALGGGLSPRGRPSAPDPGTSLFPPQSAAEHREPASTRFIPAPVELFPVCPHEWQKTEAELLLQQQERLARRMAAAAPNPLSFSDDGTASGIVSAPEGRSECLSGECPPGAHSATVEKSSSPAARARVGSILRVRSPIAALGAGVSGEFDGTSSSNPAAAAGAQSSSFLTSPLRPGSVPLPTVGGVPVGRAAVTPQPRKKRTAIHLVALRHYTVAARDPHDRSDQDARSAHQSRVPSSTVPEHLPVAKPVSESVRQALLKPLYD